jgi:hypothetical protein
MRSVCVLVFRAEHSRSFLAYVDRLVVRNVMAGTEVGILLNRLCRSATLAVMEMSLQGVSTRSSPRYESRRRPRTEQHSHSGALSGLI